MRNVTGPPVIGDDLYGRQREIDQLWARLETGAHLLILAPRRVGKTSLMQELHREPRANWDVVYIDVEDATGAEDLVARVFAALVRHPNYRLRIETSGISRTVKNALASFENLKVLGVELRTALGGGGDWARAADQLEARLLRVPNQRRLLIILDELPILVSRILDSDGGRDEAALLLAKLRQWRQAPALRGKVQTLIGGSIGLDGVLRRARLSASINDVEAFPVASWDVQTATAFVKLVGESAGFPLAQQSIDRMLALLRDPIPYHVQLFFATLQDICHGDPSKISHTVIDRCFEERLTGPAGTAHLNHYAARLEFAFSEPQRELALAVLSIACRRANGTRLLGLAAASEDASLLGEVLPILEMDGYLGVRGDVAAFRSNLLRVWWRKHHGRLS